MKPIFQYSTILLFVTVLFYSCKCDDPTDILCPNYDPCLSIAKADASFVVLDSITPTWADTSISFISKTFNTGATVYFRALNKNMASYEWKVGTDDRVWTDSEFHLGFDGYEGSVTIRLVTTVTDNNSCLNEVEMRDTSYQTFNVIQLEPYTSPIFGEYQGINTTSPNDIYSLVVLGEGANLWHSSRLFGLTIPCEYPIGLRFFAGYDWFVSVHDDIHCRNTIVIGRLQEDNNTLIMDYWYDDDAGKRQHYVFEGVRQ